MTCPPAYACLLVAPKVAKLMQAFDWDFDIHAWAQHEHQFYTLLLMELFKAEGLLVRWAAPLAVA